MCKYGVQTDVEVLDMLDTLATQKEVYLLSFHFSVYIRFMHMRCVTI